MIDKILTVDPGANTGWALWKRNISQPVAVGVFRAKGDDRIERLRDLLGRFDVVVREQDPERVVIEGVEFWGGSLQSVTAGKTGDLFQLAYTVGGFAGICLRWGIPFEIIPARAWKGQMDKIAVHARIRMALGRDYPEHTADAVGIGLSLRGEL